MKCPVCRAIYRAERKQESEIEAAPALNCRRCGVDLSPLIQLHDQALWHYRQAIQTFDSGDYNSAMIHNNQALALDAHQADFHALAGQLWALQGDFDRAIAAWKTAQQLDPQNSTAPAGLQFLAGDKPQ